MESKPIQEGIIEALAAAVETRSGESGAHVRRIRDITKFLLIYTELGEGISPQETEKIAAAAMLHDVGKVAISDAILNKPGRLTPEEYNVDNRDVEIHKIVRMGALTNSRHTLILISFWY